MTFPMKFSMKIALPGFRTYDHCRILKLYAMQTMGIYYMNELLISLYNVWENQLNHKSRREGMT